MNLYETQLKKISAPVECEVVLLTDNKNGMKASIAPHSGGELSSLQILWQGAWRETIYRANDFRPTDGWRGRAPTLWPAVGRNYTSEQLRQIKQNGRTDVSPGSYLIGNQKYPMPDHGFVMERPWTLNDHGHDVSKAWAQCAAQSDEFTRQYYPFDFTLSVTYTLAAGVLSIRYRVTPQFSIEHNSTSLTDTQAMFFSIGNHITFKLPFNPQGSYEETLLSAPTKRQLELTPESLLSGEALEKDLTQGVSLNDESLYDMVISGFERDNIWVRIVDPNAFGFQISQRGWVEKSGDAVELPPPDYYFVFYGIPEAGLFCPEPWIGGPNSLNTKKGVVWLHKNEQFEWIIQVELLRDY
ncbi:MAG: aldose 1-epimerase [Candidatus Poribacteria bacterium]